MRLSSPLIVNTLLFFNLKNLLQILSINKSLQSKANLRLINYHLFHLIQSNLLIPTCQPIPIYVNLISLI